MDERNELQRCDLTSVAGRMDVEIERELQSCIDINSMVSIDYDYKLSCVFFFFK